MWYDKCNDVGPLCQIVSRKDIYEARLPNNANVADLIVTIGFEKTNGLLSFLI